MRIFKVFTAVFVLSFVLTAWCLADKEESFPKIGFAKNDGANVRAGDNVNFESLYRLEKGDPVKIIGRRYSWFKIILPKKAHLYIKNDFIDVDLEDDTEDIGVVNAMRVNLRAGPGTKYSILRQVSKPETLTLFSENDGWYEIEPPGQPPGWIHASQLTFGLSNIKDLN